MPTRSIRTILALLPLVAAAVDGQAPSGIDRYVTDAQQHAVARQSSPGSAWYPGATLANLGSDLKAGQVDDLVTILVSDRASAVSKGATKTTRKSTAQYSVGGFFGPTRATGPWPNMVNASGASALDGQGETSRENTLTTSLSARVVGVLPNGYLVLEGTKNIVVNSETQLVTVRGVVRPFDISPANTVRSERLAELEVRVNGKGVVGDAIRRPFFLYRLLLGLLPF